MASAKRVIPQIPPPREWQSRLKAVIKPGLVPLTLLLRRRPIARYLAREPRPKLHVGCGGYLLPGWLNTDLSILNRRQVTYLDVRKKLPFPDESFSYVFNEHLISYLTLEEGIRFFKECHRVLRPGGVLRTATAGWPFLLQLGQSNDIHHRDYVRWATDQFLKVGYYSRCLVMNNFLYVIGSKMIYDPECLTWALSQAGFSQIIPAKVGESLHPELRGVEGHGKFIPAEFNELETFVLEATKV